MENKNTEIDLIELLVKTMLFFKKYMLFFGSAIILGIIISILVYYSADKLYKGHLIITTNNNDGILFSLFESLSDEIDDGSISKSLNISNNIADNIVSIEISNVETPNPKILNEKPKEFYRIDLILKDSVYFKQVEDGFRCYASNNNYLKSLNDFEKQKRDELIENVKKEIAKFDSVRNEHLKSNIFISNGLEFKNGIVYLYEKKNDLEKKNKFSSVFKVIKDFNISPITNIRRIMVKYILSMLIIAFIIAILIETRKIINNYTKNNLKPNN